MNFCEEQNMFPNCMRTCLECSLVKLAAVRLGT